jgi:hypothetical protein
MVAIEVLRDSGAAEQVGSGSDQQHRFNMEIALSQEGQDRWGKTWWRLAN